MTSLSFVSFVVINLLITKDTKSWGRARRIHMRTETKAWNSGAVR